MGREFFKRLERWEKRLQVFVVILFSLLVILQPFMSRDPLRFYMSFAEKMEGVPLSGHFSAVNNQDRGRVGYVKIEMQNYFILPRAVVSVNGEDAAAFEERDVLLTVEAGDEIVIDGTAYPYPITFQVSSVSEGVCWPPVNYQVSTDSSRVSLGKVKFE